MAYTQKNGKPLRLLMSSVAEGETVTAAQGTVLSEDKTGIRIATGEGVLLLTRLQLPGGKALSVTEFLNGRSLAGEHFPS
jgi:methionyl-tRNA formyltransferase